VSVDPDPSVLRALLNNRKAHRCNFHVWAGVISETPLRFKFSHTLYASATESASSANAVLPEAPRIADFRAMEDRIGARFTVLLIDCEGCMDFVFSGKNAQLLHQVRVVLLEEDGPTKKLQRGSRWNVTAAEYYGSWFRRLKAAGFERRWHISDSLFSDDLLGHSAWVRSTSPPTIYCPEYARTRSLLNGKGPLCSMIE
jgi:hypothetical protein